MSGLNRFELIRRLGAGSIGVVFEAYDRQENRRVALKQLRSVVPAGVYRLQREFDVLRRLSHPNVIELYDLIVDQTPPFFTMELIEGRDFYAHVCRQPHALHTDTRISSSHDVTDGERTRHGDRPIFSMRVHADRLRRVLGQVAEALHAIHQAGVIHRDLKPSNILVTDAGRAVVMDFSIATKAREHAEHAVSAGVLIGTPEFMAPEQAAGDPPSPAADWYSLGTMLYLVITGRLPFTGTWNRVIEDKQAYDPIPATELVDDVPGDLSELCAALLARHPYQRPASNDVFRRLGLSLPPGMRRPRPALMDAAFTDREQDLWHLQGAFQGAASGMGRCVLVTGEPGIGKTRLLIEFLERLSEDRNDAAIAISGRCYPDDQRCFNAFDDVMETLSQTLANLDRERCKRLLPDDSDLLPRMFPAFLRVPAIERAPRQRDCNLSEIRSRTVTVLNTLIERFAAQNPLVVCIDDMQWADRDSVELLRDVFGATRPRRVLLVLAMRSAVDPSMEMIARSDEPEPAYDPRSEIEVFAQQRTFRMRLSELSPTAREQMWARMSRRHPVLKRYPDVSSGVPLLLVERANSVLEGVLDGGGREGTDGLDDIFARRITSLSDDYRSLLDVIALMRSPTPLSLLAKAADVSMEARRKACNRLLKFRLIHNVREGREPWLVVAHEEIRVIVLSQLSPEQVRVSNQRLALAFERSGKMSNGVLAACWRAAGDEKRALSYWELAAKSARDRLAFHQAARIYRVAVETVATDSAVSERLLYALADQLARAGRHREAALAYERIAIATEPSSVSVRIQAADHWLRAGEIELGCERMVASASALHVPMSPDRSKLASLSRKARLKLRRRRHRMRDENEVAVQDLQAIDRLFAIAMVLEGLSPEEAAHVYTEHLLRVFLHGERRRVIRALVAERFHVAMQAVRSLEPIRTEGSIEPVGDTGRRDPYTDGLRDLGTGMSHRWFGVFERAESHLQRAIDTLVMHTPDSHWELEVAHYLHCLTRIDRGQGRGEQRRIEQTVERALRTGNVFQLTLFGCIPRMWTLIWRDRVDEGFELLDRLESTWQRPQSYPMRTLIDVARAMGWVYTRRSERASEAIDRCTASVHASGRNHVLFEIERLFLRTRVALLQTDSATANKAAKELEKLGTALGIAHATATRATLAYRNGDERLARQLIENAAARYEQCGALPFLFSTRFRVGQLVGGDAGDAQQQASKSWYEHQGIANVACMLDYLFPWSTPENATDTREQR